MALTLDMPFLGPLSIDSDGPVSSSGIPSGTGSMIGAAAGSVVPGLGTVAGAAVGSLAESVSKMFKGKTKKVPYDTADAEALKISHELAKQAQAAKSATDFDRLAPGYITFVEQYLRATDWWSKAEALRIADELKNDVHKLYSKSSYDKVQGCVWLLSMWILTQSPADRYDWIKGYLETHLGAAYLAYWFPGQSVTLPTVQQPATTAQPGAATSPASTQAAVQAAQQKEVITYALIIGGIFLLLITVVVLLRK
jgi:hypothetical protein